MSEIVEINACFTGMVQGVFFRAQVKKHADLLKINGSVENLSDGSVELHAVGKKEELEKLISSIKSNPGAAKIEEVSFSYSEISTKYEGFNIIR